MQVINISSKPYHGKILIAARMFIASGEPICRVTYPVSDYISTSSCVATICTSLRRHGGECKSLRCRRRGDNIYLTNSSVSRKDFIELIGDLL